MKITVQMFAAARQLAGSERITMELPGGSTIADLRSAIERQHPALSGLLARTRFAVNLEFAGEATPLNEDAEVAFIPPVSGG